MTAETAPDVTEVTTTSAEPLLEMRGVRAGYGRIEVLHGIDLAIERAKEHGTAAIGVRESTHLGALAYYTERAARAGCCAIAVQNGPTIVPPMSRKFKKSSSLSSAVTITLIFPSCTSVATVNLPLSPTGRIDQRTIWLKSLSKPSQPVHCVAQRLPPSLVKATVLPRP